MPISYHMLTQMGYGHIGFTQRAAQAMEAYSWPGNIRQLFNVLAHASLRCQANIIELSDLPGELTQHTFGYSCREENIPLADYMARQEEMFLRRALQRWRGNITDMAKKFHVSRVTLYNKFKKYNITVALEKE